MMGMYFNVSFVIFIYVIDMDLCSQNVCSVIKNSFHM